MKKSIKLLLAFMLFLGITNIATAQSDATFEEAINFTINNIVRSRSVGDGYVWEYKLEIDSTNVNSLDYTEDLWRVDYLALHKTYSWSMANISEVVITKEDYYYISLKCDTGKHPEGCIMKTHFKNGKFGLDWQSTELINIIGFRVNTEEMAQRVKKALDHARKLAGAKDEKF